MITYKTKKLFFYFFLICSAVHAQISIPNAESIAETFSYEIPFDEIASKIETDVNKGHYPFKGYQINETSKNKIELIGAKEASFLHLIELASPITQIAMDELKGKISAIFCKIVIEKERRKTIKVTSKILSFKIKEGVEFNELHEQGLLMYAKNIKLNKVNFSSSLKKYFLKTQSTFVIDVVKFSREKGFDNFSYAFKDFIPKTDINVVTTFNKQAPKAQKNDNILLIYSGLYSYGKKKEPSLMYALDFNKQEFLWTHIIPNNQSHQRNQFNVYKGTIYLASEHTVQALNPANKEVYWSAKFPENTPPFDLYPNHNQKNKRTKNNLFNQKAQVSGDYVFVNDAHYIYCLDRYTGKLLWTQPYGDFGSRNFHFDETYLYKSGVMEMFKIHKKTGEVAQILFNNNSNPLYADQFYEDNILVFGDERGNFAGFDTKTDKVLWNAEVWDNRYQNTDTSATKTDKVFWMFNESDVACFNALTGEPLHFTVLNEEREIKNSFQNKDYIIIYFSSENDKNNNEDVIYIINKKEKAIVKKWFIAPKDRPISNFDDSQKNRITYLSDETINIIDLEKLSIKTYVNKIIKPDTSLNYYTKNYYIDWALPK